MSKEATKSLRALLLISLVLLPGVAADDLNPELHDNRLRISVEVKDREHTGVLGRRGRRVGDFEYLPVRDLRFLAHVRLKGRDIRVDAADVVRH